MTAFPLGAFACLDTETNDKDPERARLLEISLALIVPGKDNDVRTTLVDPGDGVEIPEEATQVNGLTLDRVRSEGKPIAEVLDVWVGDTAHAVKAGWPLVIQNSPYDLCVLDRECRRHGVATLDERLGDTPLAVLDPLVLDKRCIKFRRKVSETQGARCLKTLAQVYGIPWDDDQAHGAEYDALVAARVVWRMGQWSQMSRGDLLAMGLHRNDVAAFQSLAGLTLAELHAKQVQWYAEQTESFAQYLRLEANQKRHEAALARDGGGDETADVLEQDAAELDARVDGMCAEWPVRALPVAVAS